MLKVKNNNNIVLEPEGHSVFHKLKRFCLLF